MSLKLIDSPRGLVLANELRGLVFPSHLPKGGVRRVVRRATVEEVTDAQIRREKQREKQTRWLVKSGYREKNREKIRQQTREWRLKNPERMRIASDAWKARNPEKVQLADRRSRRAWKARNIEHVRAYDREYVRTHRAQINAGKKRWYAANKDAINARRRAARRAK